MSILMGYGGSLQDEGILRAISDAGNDVLIGDYCEAAAEETLRLLQKQGASAFRVLGYCRNRAVPKLPGGLYGRHRMTQLTTHRHIDIANAVGVVAVSLATRLQLTKAEYMKFSYGTTLINDLADSSK
ncbi:uncharacterized protein ATNIH1004_009322 [Aspergillus tanneri]|uniref:Uncharacterized protein n=1 Tax=Aspergillus tanneri TaxID=1220188 RepID=A0A5M9MRC4_9EURO|nr:uncharacterized protein ATNIH1004_009322 [Aspergillus tanneri]KAA8645107.1 hypothetical protein ATNIH1004_009322 [Aspergillus tanneri]